MKIYEILNFNRELIDRMRMAGIRLEDTRYVGLYSDYEKMIHEGHKVTYVIAFLAGKYGVCERKAYSLVKRMKSDCKDFIWGGVKTAAARCKRHAAGHAGRTPPIRAGNTIFAAWDKKTNIMRFSARSLRKAKPGKTGKAGPAAC